MSPWLSYCFALGLVLIYALELWVWTLWQLCRWRVTTPNILPTGTIKPDIHLLQQEVHDELHQRTVAELSSSALSSCINCINMKQCPGRKKSTANLSVIKKHNSWRCFCIMQRQTLVLPREAHQREQLYLNYIMRLRSNSQHGVIIFLPTPFPSSLHFSQFIFNALCCYFSPSPVSWCLMPQHVGVWDFCLLFVFLNRASLIKTTWN